MRQGLALNAGLLLVCANLMSGCDKIGLSSADNGPDGSPSEQQLQQISYMSRAGAGPNGRKLYDHLEQARTCDDYELAMRWNRPPNLESGPFHAKMVYLRSAVPPDLASPAEVVITGTIVTGETLPSGSARWIVRLQDGTRVQAIETAEYWEKQAQAAQDGNGQAVAIDRPEKPGRILCAQGVYQGLAGKDPDGGAKLPLISVLFAMDRDPLDHKPTHRKTRK